MTSLRQAPRGRQRRQSNAPDADNSYNDRDAARAITLALKGRWRNEQGLACCPVHDDRSPSLSLRDGETALLVHCFAGCDARDILAELRRRGMLEARPPRQPQPVAPARRAGVHPLSDEALGLGKFATANDGEARRRAQAIRDARLDLILAGASPQEIRLLTHGRVRP
jgi:hypothetical protein